jgi:hypothetical protein
VAVANQAAASWATPRNSLGAVACLAPIGCLSVPVLDHPPHSFSVDLFLILTALLFPVQIVLAIAGFRGYFMLKQGAAAPGKLAGAMAGALLYGSVAWLVGFSSLPRIPGGSNEISAIATLRILNTSEVTYASTYHSGFPDTLTRLCPPSASESPDATHADLVDPILCGKGPDGTPTRFTKNGYFFEYVASGPFGAISSYRIQADPLVRGSSGRRSFFTDQSTILRANATNRAIANGPPLR